METLFSEHSGRYARAMTRRPRVAASAAALAFAALVLSACAAPAEPAESADPVPQTETSSPAPEPEPEPGAQPASRYDLSCDELVPAQAVSDMFGTALGSADPLVTAASAGISVPRMASIESVGGLACEWSNGEPSNSQYGGNPAYTGVLVSVVPPQDGGWSTNAVDAGMPAPGSSCGPSICEITAVSSSGAWITVLGSTGTDNIVSTGAQAVADAAAAAIDAASPPALAPVVESAVPADCEALVRVATVESVTGTTGLVAGAPGGGWSDWAEARSIAGDLGCMWQPDGADVNVAAAHWVRGGRWAFDRIEVGGALVPAPTDLTIASADRALVRCDATYGICGVDLLIGPDWVQVTASEQEDAVAVATEIAAGMSS